MVRQDTTEPALCQQGLLALNIKNVQLITEFAIGGEALDKGESLFLGHCVAPPAIDQPIGALRIGRND
ncbi:hypothetical protein [Azospirillum sp. TSH100]|uniref:hypothetical protein n=1 Tax=Azospirillum sp. TSH100 TaxID=652764 RepID=UPI0010AB300B|nr:hypothetical protein [Azospirillum sp. TSH100]QCG86481.1 hypothetical protein E6C72_01280 [Azospirillum sp. TSH100]